MTPAAGGKTRSVLIAVDVGRGSARTINLAVSVAKAANTRLCGLFVEDEDLLQLTKLPVTREILLSSARERPIDTDRMQRALRSAAERFRHRLEREAQALQIGCSFETVRGRMREVGLHPPADVDFMIIGQPTHREQARDEVGIYRILMVTARSPRQREALAAVMSGLTRRKVELTLVGRESRAQLMAEIEQAGYSRNNRLSVVDVERSRLGELLQHSGSRFDIAIVSQREKSDRLTTLLSYLHCPVMLVS